MHATSCLLAILQKCSDILMSSCHIQATTAVLDGHCSQYPTVCFRKIIRIAGLPVWAAILIQ